MLNAPAASGADSQLAGLASEEETGGFKVADDKRVASAGSEALEAGRIRVDAGEEVKPELAFGLAVVKADDLLGRVAMDGRLSGALRGKPQLLAGHSPVRWLYG